jgi:hypothetical protein
MWCILPPMVGTAIVLFFWTFAMIDRMAGATKPSSSVGIVVWFFFAGVLLAFSHACLPHESCIAAPASGMFFACLSFVLGAEYRRQEHAWPGSRDVITGIACGIAIGAPVVCSDCIRPFLPPGWILAAIGG